MEKFYSFEKYQDLKISPLNSTILGVSSNRDIQIFKFDPLDNGVLLKLQQVIEIG
jgi:hypothetical protein